MSYLLIECLPQGQRQGAPICTCCWNLEDVSGFSDSFHTPCSPHADLAPVSVFFGQTGLWKAWTCVFSGLAGAEQWPGLGEGIEPRAKFICSTFTLWMIEPTDYCTTVLFIKWVETTETTDQPDIHFIICFGCNDSGLHHSHISCPFETSHMWNPLLAELETDIIEETSWLSGFQLLIFNVVRERERASD